MDDGFIWLVPFAVVFYMLPVALIVLAVTQVVVGVFLIRWYRRERKNVDR